MNLNQYDSYNQHSRLKIQALPTYLLSKSTIDKQVYLHSVFRILHEIKLFGSYCPHGDCNFVNPL